jgi:uncharacterized protein YkwD
MGRFLALMAAVLTLGLALGVSPTYALDPTAAVKGGTSPSDWFNQQKGQNPNWEVTGKISPAMSQILSQALIDFGSYPPRNTCEGAAAGQAWQALADAANSGPLEAFLDAIKGALGGIKDVATFGADPTAAADLLSPQALTQKAFDQAKEMGEDKAKDWLKEKLKQIWNGKKVEVLSRTETRGSCETMLVATWDEGAGTYEIVIYGDCHCAAVGGWSIGSTGTSVRTFAVTLRGKVTAAIKDGAGVFIVGFPSIVVTANCGCAPKSSSTTGGGAPGGQPVTPGPTDGGGKPKPPLYDDWAKVSTKCAACQPLVDQIHAAQAARDQMTAELRDAKDRYDSAQANLRTASAGDRPAAQAKLDGADAAMDALRRRDAGLLELEQRLWAQLKTCEANCGHASSGNCPARDGQYAAATPANARMAEAVLAQVNAARADPHAYAETLRGFEADYHGKVVTEPGHPAAMTIEGVAAVENAVGYLAARAPSPPLQWNDGLASAANRLVADLGPKGRLGHTGSDGSTMTQRIRAVCIWAAAMEEDISLVPRTAEGVVRQLVIDDGVPTRGHRTAIFDPGLSIAGVACGPHAAYGWMCVIDFAGAMMAAPGSESGGGSP